ncbi:MAG TPA: hypothetical protein VFZ59_01185, partial [Verrucomicrobiae bacterium]|nr:hypothetical protein [Verrucomicrobiae bacterium]
MGAALNLPVCPKCRVHLGPGVFNLGGFARCPNCQAQLWVEVFNALFRPLTSGSASEAVMIAGESTCFYHDSKKAVVVCDACGRFLCGLCDCNLNGKHYCPPCLESGAQKRTIEQLEKSRPLHGRQALILAILPLFLTGLAALFIALRYWKAPGSLVKPQRWLMPTALGLAIL